MSNISVSSVVTDVTDSTSAMKAAPAMAADTTSGKRNICKNFINNAIRLQICIMIYVKNRSMRIINSNNIYLLSNV